MAQEKAPHYPACWLLHLLCLMGVSLGCLRPVAAHSRTFVLRADGTGDVLTFQAGVDSLAAWFDTLLVEPGAYDENVQVPVSSSGVIVCPQGAGRTTIRSLRSTTWKPQRLDVCGLGVVDSAVVRTRIGFRDCLFGGAVAFNVPQFFETPPFFVRCRFADRFYYRNQGSIDSCEFKGAVTLQTYDDPIHLHGCTFTGQDTAVTAIPGMGISFDGCTFDNVGWGIVRLGWSLRGITVERSRFTDVRGAAVAFEYPELGEYPGGGLGKFIIRQSRFERCGTALRVNMAGRIQLVMTEDTLSDCRESAIHCAALRREVPWAVVDCSMDGVTVDGSGAMGANLIGLGTAEIEDCVFATNKAGGLKATLGPSFDIERAVLGRCTFASNGGPGLVIVEDEGSEPATMPVTVERSIFAANDGAGVLSTLPYPIDIRHGDTWFNRDGDYIGLVNGQDNLTLDPQFCDPLAGDFRVTASSPCAPSGPYGQIGALGVGCDAMTVPVDVENHPVNLRANAPVEAAILGHRLFDPRTVDVATVRLAGTPPAPRGRRGSDLRDVNQDGLTDLLLSFDARDLRLDEGEAQLQGRTRDGAPFRGADAVEVKSLSARAALGDAATVEVPSRLALSVQAARGAGEIRLLLDLPSSEPARVEVFDVSGRRLQTSAVTGLGPGRHAFTLTRPLKSGLYLVRLSQEAEAIVGRAVMLR